MLRTGCCIEACYNPVRAFRLSQEHAGQRFQAEDHQHYLEHNPEARTSSGREHSKDPARGWQRILEDEQEGLLTMVGHHGTYKESENGQYVVQYDKHDDQCVFIYLLDLH